MTGIFAYGEAEYDIDDAKVARWLGTGLYDTPVDCPAINMFRVEFVMKSQTGDGDGGLQLVASAIRAANVTIRNFGIVTEQLPILYGASNDEYGTGDDVYTVQDMVTEEPLPYFGAMIRSIDNESAPAAGHSKGGVLIFVPKIKITQNSQWEFSDNNFVQPEMTGFAMKDANLQSHVSGRKRFVRIYKYNRDLPQIPSVWPL